MKAKLASICLLLAVALALTGCGPLLPGPSSGGQDGASNGSSADGKGNSMQPPETGGGTAAKDEPTEDSSFNKEIAGHEMQTAGSPVAGSYVTTSGVKLTLGDDGSYRWDETSVGGDLLTGTYLLYEGTPKQTDSGEAVYTMNSSTGPLYTLIVYFDESSYGATSALTILVFDTYDANTFLVTDLLYKAQFEANRV